MSDNINLYNQINFLVNGGALKSLTDFLASKNFKALVLEKNNSVLNVLEAAGIVPESLTLQDDISKLFKTSVVKETFEVDFCESSNSWPEIFRISGQEWEIFILLEQKVPDPEKFMKELEEYAGLISLWEKFRKISEIERKLSRLSYIFLATKNTLASIFEPMPLEYFASFMYDVLKESIFPKSITILKDDGNSLRVMKGNAENIPERTGIFAEQILPPAPVNLNDRTVVPVWEGDLRLFCVIEWENFPDEQTLNFLELFENLARSALAVNKLRAKNLE